MKTIAKTYNTQETAFFLRQSLGNSFSWVKVLESMRNDGYSVCGIDLQPCTKLPRGIPVYASHDIAEFARKLKSKFPHLSTKQPIQSVTVEYDPSLSWLFQRSKPIKTRLIRGVRAAAVGLGLSAMMMASSCAHATKPDEAKAVYVGGGRYVCHGNSAQCAQIEANNRAQEERERNRYEDEQRRMNDRIRDERRNAQENRNRY